MMIEEIVGCAVWTLMGVLPTYWLWFWLYPAELQRVGGTISRQSIFLAIIGSFAGGALVLAGFGITVSLFSAGTIGVFAPLVSMRPSRIVFLIGFTSVLGNLLGIIVSIRMASSDTLVGDAAHEKT